MSVKGPGRATKPESILKKTLRDRQAAAAFKKSVGFSDTPSGGDVPSTRSYSKQDAKAATKIQAYVRDSQARKKLADASFIKMAQEKVNQYNSKSQVGAGGLAGRVLQRPKLRLIWVQP